MYIKPIEPALDEQMQIITFIRTIDKEKGRSRIEKFMYLFIFKIIICWANADVYRFYTHIYI